MSDSPPIFRVIPWAYHVGGFVDRHPDLFVRLGNLESRLLEHQIEASPVREPVYVCGLARSGTTILLEMLSRHPDVVSHRYADYPFVFLPYLWNTFLKLSPGKSREVWERAHRDGLLVSDKSPEAFEELVWMAFFEGAHDPSVSQVLGRDTRNPDFEGFYTRHIRKLLSVRGGERYVSKGNYNLTRIAYLHRLFPDARFIVPVRSPVAHVASLVKQHRLFLRGQQEEPRAINHLGRTGHFEFGVDRRPINAGDSETVESIIELWSSGEEVRGLARYWAMVYRHVDDVLREEEDLADSVFVSRYEDLVEDPGRQLSRLFRHAELPLDEETVANLASEIRAPDYYRPDFTDSEMTAIDEETRDVARRFGYDD